MTKQVKDWKAFRKIVKDMKQSFFDNKIQEIALKIIAFRNL